MPDQSSNKHMYCKQIIDVNYFSITLQRINAILESTIAKTYSFSHHRLHPFNNSLISDVSWMNWKYVYSWSRDQLPDTPIMELSIVLWTTWATEQLNN